MSISHTPRLLLWTNPCVLGTGKVNVERLGPETCRGNLDRKNGGRDGRVSFNIHSASVLIVNGESEN